MSFNKQAVIMAVISSMSCVALADTNSDQKPATGTRVSEQSQAEGYLEGQSLTGLTKNWYSNELRYNGEAFRYQKHGQFQPTRRRINWVQGTILDHTSGFTQGTVGFATQVALYNTVALDRSRKDIANGSNRTLAENNGDAVDQWSKLGLANAKMRISNTTVTLGRQSFSSPTVEVMPTRALPSSFQGVSVHSAEFDDVSLDFGSFDRVSPRTEQSLAKFRGEYQAISAEADRVNVFGVSYKPVKNLSTSFYATQVEDFWNQYYIGASHDLGDASKLGLNTSLNYYKTKDSGQKKLGDIDNDAYSLAFALKHLGHTLTLAYQQIIGDEYFDYLHETGGIYLANAALSDYNGPNEKSLQLSYAVDMAQYGVPGLKLSVYHIRGWDIDGTNYKGTAYDVRSQDGERHHESGVGAFYVIQSGQLKSSSVRALYTKHTASQFQADGNVGEFRLVTTVPFSLF
ncbi:OprD family porin [Pseudomonas sp. CG7]|uniref:OprD family outer membrane porin n=1 Tax=Pseudomonas sp. CG7 TaxID=191007 RepID=UPI00203320B1|nr:OprD family outer membrane porin [Pseudomonas sp. CG7]MCM2459443.1 OprD family porin [Pseudomonas sp. CG7]